MFDNYTRKLKVTLFAPLVTVFGRFSPDTITWIALLLGIAAAVCAGLALYGAGLALWLLNRIFDGLDGELARKSGRQTDFGGYLDIVFDFVVYAAVPVGLVFGVDSAELWEALAFLLGAFYVNAASWMYLAAILEKRQAGAAAQQEFTSITMPSGLIAGTETIIIFSAFFLFPAWLAWLYWSMGGLIMVGVVQRLVWAKRAL
jgi:phosphatidylglycerophosphate synthase